MKVVALGGSGAMGRHAVRAALADERIEEIVVADLDGDAAARFAESCGPRVRGQAIDVQDEAALKTLLCGADAVMNTVGPFFRFGVSILKASIAAGCPYIDINDDWEPTLDMLALDDEARRAGVCAVIGVGASPGISNLLAVRAVEALDLADEVFTVWDLDGSGDGGEAAASEKTPAPGPNRPSAAMVHFVQQITGKIRAWEQGALRDVRPLQKIVLEVPLVGNVVVHTVGHPESVTLPGTYPRLTGCTNAFTAKPATVLALKAIAKAVDANLVSMERAARWIEGSEASPPPDEVPIAMDPANPEAAPPLFAMARGEKAGKPATSAAAITAGPRGGMGPITGIPLGIGLSLLTSGAIDQPGVHPPEAVIEPHDFFRAFAPWCDPKPASPGDLVSVAVG